MLVTLNQEALDRIAATGLVHYYHPWKRKVVRKGESSGHSQEVMEIRLNCSGDQLLLGYRLPQPAGAEAAPDGLPAMEFVVRRGERESRGWLIASADAAFTADGARYVVAPLGDLLAAEETPSEQATSTALYLAERLGQVKDWKSTLSVVEENQPVLTKTIEVNRPLHYGGYRFFQHSVRDEDPTYTQLSVASDSGLMLIYLGFIGLGGGAFWWMWLQPVWAYVTRRGRGGDGA